MRIAMLSPISWCTPPRHYSPWENMVSLLTEELLKMGKDITLFATADSKTAGELASVCLRPYSEDSSLNPMVWECLHISEVFERADEFDIIHNNLGFLPLTYSSLIDTPIVTTIHGLPSPATIPVFKKYNKRTHYIAISEADKNQQLDYISTINHGIDVAKFPFSKNEGKYLLFFGRIDNNTGVPEAIEVARKAGVKLVIAGLIQDEDYFKTHVKPHIDGDTVQYRGSVVPEERAKLMGEAIALLHLANSDESSGMYMIEAMACGSPVITYAHSSARGIVKNGENGFIVKNSDEAVKAIEKIKTINRGNCRSHVEANFTIKIMAEKYLNAYKQILDKRQNYRPWGHYEILSERENHKVKSIIVQPGKRLSLQKHKRRAEHWVVVSGTAIVTLGEKEIPLKAGESVDIPRGAVHRITNPGTEPLTFVEAQMGDYFGEDDIIRLEDDFGRAE